MADNSNITRDEAIVRQTVAGIVLSPEDYEAVQQARKRNPILHMDHIGLACRDAAETRHFYEELLGLPLVSTIVLDDPFRTDGAQYCHFFFEMADGNYIAFFDHSDLFKPEDFSAKTGFHQHFAMEVASDETVQNYRERLTNAGIQTMFIDHGLYRSLYFTDPNGINLEITYKIEGTADFEVKSRKVARKLLDSWIAQRPARTETAA